MKLSLYLSTLIPSSLHHLSGPIRLLVLLTASLLVAAEPSPGFNFNIAMYGDNPEDIDGTQLSAEWAFSSLQMFGQEFLKKLRGKKLPNKLLEKVIKLCAAVTSELPKLSLSMRPCQATDLV